MQQTLFTACDAEFDEVANKFVGAYVRERGRVAHIGKSVIGLLRIDGSVVAPSKVCADSGLSSRAMIGYSMLYYRDGDGVLRSMHSGTYATSFDLGEANGGGTSSQLKDLVEAHTSEMCKRVNRAGNEIGFAAFPKMIHIEGLMDEYFGVVAIAGIDDLRKRNSQKG